jgi:hypothetical protein
MVKKEYVLCAAIYYNDGKEYPHQPKNIQTGFVICGRRHHNCISTLSTVAGIKTKAKDIQGFITNTDLFVNRQEAYLIALKAGQIKPRKEDKELNDWLKLPQGLPDILISEDLYSEDLY